MRIFRGEVGQALLMHPLFEKPGEVLAGSLLKCLLQILPRGSLVAVRADEVSEGFQKNVVAKAFLEHVEYHRSLAVPDRLRRVICPAPEVSQWKLVSLMHVTLIINEEGLSVSSAGVLLLLKKMIGQVGGQPLSPIALCVVDVDKIPEPLMEDLVTQRSLRYEGQPDNLLAEQCEGGHRVTCGKYVLDDGESLVRVRSEHISIKFQISFCLFDVRLRQFGICLEEIGKNIHASEPVCCHLILVRCNERYLVERIRKSERENSFSLAYPLLNNICLGNCFKTAR